MKKIAWLAAAALAVASTASAGTDDGSRQSALQGGGAAAGMIAGAAAGGPFGIVVGALVGAAVGQHAHDRKELPRVEAELASVRGELDGADEQIGSLEDELARQVEALDGLRADRAALTRALTSGLELDVYFRTGEESLRPEDAARVRELGHILASLSGVGVKLDGHADPRGDEQSNQQLSDERVASVARALMDGGLRDPRIEGKGYGEALSEAADGDLDAFAMERRVHILVTGEAAALAVAER